MTLVGLYNYRAKITNVVDGDTLDATLDFGFRIQAEVRLRLNGVNTPELHSPDAKTREWAQKAKIDTATWCGEFSGTDWPFYISTSKTDAFGRYLADVYRVKAGGTTMDPTSLSAHLLALGYPPYERT